MMKKHSWLIGTTNLTALVPKQVLCAHLSRVGVNVFRARLFSPHRVNPME
jgi:hypothetical protein